MLTWESLTLIRANSIPKSKSSKTLVTTTSNLTNRNDSMIERALRLVVLWFVTSRVLWLDDARGRKPGICDRCRCHTTGLTMANGGMMGLGVLYVPTFIVLPSCQPEQQDNDWVQQLKIQDIKSLSTESSALDNNVKIEDANMADGSSGITSIQEVNWRPACSNANASMLNSLNEMELVEPESHLADEIKIKTEPEEHTEEISNNSCDSDDAESTTEEERFQCMFKKCAKSFETKEEARDHVNKDHVRIIPKFNCKFPACNARFPYLEALEEHVLTHFEDGEIKCCGRSFAEKESLQRHLRTHSSNPGFICSFSGCQKVLDSYEKLKKHVFSHREVMRFKCNFPGCRSCFDEAAKLRIHSMKHARKKYLRCKYQNCSARFMRITDLKRHTGTHGDEGPLPCFVDWCERRFQDKTSLTNHLLGHPGKPPFKCKRCAGEEDITSRALLARHASHHGLQFKCKMEGCSQTFLNNFYLENHMRAHTTFKCTWYECNRVFSTKEEMDKHRVIHKKDVHACKVDRCHLLLL